MSLANCPRCNKAFNKLNSSPLCTSCRQRDDEDFEIVYQYLRDHPNKLVPEIAAVTGVDEKNILEFYRSGRIITGEAGYPCERCDTPIHRGKYCDRCAGGLKSDIDSQRSSAPDLKVEREGGTAPRRDFSHQLRIDRR